MNPSHANREWRWLHNEELDSLYRLSNVVREIESRRLRWADHLARMEEYRSVFNILIGKTGKREVLQSNEGKKKNAAP